jgi:prepilin-type N-terminal cleavage/methylation domain-containing protein
MAKNSSDSRAFTLIELIVVLAIIAILMSMVYPVFTGLSERAKATKDMSNLRQIGIATQTYLNDSDGVLFSTAGGAGTWMAQLHPKYLSGWRVFQSPFDRRAASEADASAPISYGLNGNTKDGGSSIAGLLATKIANPSVFILFAPAQAPGTTVTFAGGTAAAVTVYKNVNPAASGGTHNTRKRINAVFADLHAETMLWSKFVLDSDPNDPSATLRWDPYLGYP